MWTKVILDPINASSAAAAYSGTLDLVAKMQTRTITDGSTVTMKSVNRSLGGRRSATAHVTQSNHGSRSGSGISSLRPPAADRRMPFAVTQVLGFSVRAIKALSPLVWPPCKTQGIGGMPPSVAARACVCTLDGTTLRSLCSLHMCCC